RGPEEAGQRPRVPPHQLGRRQLVPALPGGDQRRVGRGEGLGVGHAGRTVDVGVASILRRTGSDSVGPKPAGLAHGPSLPVPVRLRPPLYFAVLAPSFEIRTIVRIHMRPYDERLDHLLARAAKIFAERGYHSTTMRDLAAASGMSLAGMYYYVKGKEELLSLIEERCFTRVLDG